MSALRRTAVLIGLTACVVVGSSIPASATFTDSVKVTPSVSTGTVDVKAPTNIRVTLTCRGQDMYATVTWTRSTTTTVSGYRVVATLGGQQLTLNAAGTASRVDTTVNRVWAAYQVPVTVTSLTGYGWSETSAPVTVTTC
ncbi:hypothetical protein [Blastococcus sp. SYSU DS0617]